MKTAPASSPPGAGNASTCPVGELSFTVEIPGFSIGRFAECGGLTVEYDVFEYQEGGQNGFVHKLRGPVRYPNVVLKRGLTEEQALLEWFQRAQDVAGRPTVVITLRGPDARPVRRWACEGAFPLKWTGPSLNAGSSNVATEQLEFAHRGFLGGS